MMEQPSPFSRDPEIVGGALVFAGTRLPARNLFDYLMLGESIETFVDHFPSVDREQVEAALAFFEARIELMRRAPVAR